MKSLQHHLFISKPPPFLQIPTTHLPFPLPFPPPTKITSPFPRFPLQNQISSQKSPPLLQKSPEIHLPTIKIPPFSTLPAILSSLALPFPSLAAETELVYSDKISIESILVSIDDFFNRYPFFVAGCTFIWLVVLPLTEEYLKKCKFVPAIDAFRKLQNQPEAQLLDIRKEQSLDFMKSPNLKILGKNVVRVEFVEGEEEGFVGEVLKRFDDPGSTVLCVLDNFDGNSLKVAELLFKNGFKEAYAIKGGLRGKDGWQAIQETLLPPSVHVYPRTKKSKSSFQSEETRQRTQENNTRNGQPPTSSTYPDLKPPTSPTPSKPQN